MKVNEEIEADKTSDEIRQEPLSLPSGFTWDTLDISEPLIVSLKLLSCGEYFFSPRTWSNVACYGYLFHIFFSLDLFWIRSISLLFFLPVEIRFVDKWVHSLKSKIVMFFKRVFYYKLAEGLFQEQEFKKSSIVCAEICMCVCILGILVS